MQLKNRKYSTLKWEEIIIAISVNSVHKKRNNTKKEEDEENKNKFFFNRLEDYVKEAIQSYEEANALLDQKNARKDDSLRLGNKHPL